MKTTLTRKLFLIFTLIFSLLIPSQIFSQNSDSISAMDYFRKKRSADYNYAVNKSTEIYAGLVKAKYPYALEAASIIFPELIRYSEMQDRVESLINELLSYTTEESNGFSIGLMQMKPDFAATIERIVYTTPELKAKYPSICLTGETETASDRHDRILRLKEESYQTLYLRAFVDFEIKKLDLEKENLQTRIKYLSAAYNAGLQYSKKQLEKYFYQNAFPSGKRGLYFNYSTICIEASNIIKNRYIKN